MSERCAAISAVEKFRCDRDAGHGGNHYHDAGNVVCAWGFEIGAAASGEGSDDGG